MLSENLKSNGDADICKHIPQSLLYFAQFQHVEKRKEKFYAWFKKLLDYHNFNNTKKAYTPKNVYLSFPGNIVTKILLYSRNSLF